MKLPRYAAERLAAARALVAQDRGAMREIAMRIAPLGYSAELRARRLLEAVQAVTRYELDGSPSRSPLATWARGSGSCADAAPLLACLAEAIGLRAELVYQIGPTMDHLTCKIKVGDRWLWAEPTIQGAELGESPAAAAMRTASAREEWAR